MNGFGDVLLWSFWFFIWVTAVVLWFRCFWDLFSDSTLSGWAKAGWSLFLIVVPWLGALIYIIVRGASMGTRNVSGIVPEEDRHAAYMRGLREASSADSASHDAAAQALLDSGAVTQEEYDRLKTKSAS